MELYAPDSVPLYSCFLDLTGAWQTICIYNHQASRSNIVEVYRKSNLGSVLPLVEKDQGFFVLFCFFPLQKITSAMLSVYELLVTHVTEQSHEKIGKNRIPNAKQPKFDSNASIYQCCLVSLQPRFGIYTMLSLYLASQ